jgi:hypothetical protein
MGLTEEHIAVAMNASSAFTRHIYEKIARKTCKRAFQRGDLWTFTINGA